MKRDGGGTYGVYYHGTEDRCGDFTAVFGVFCAAHHSVTLSVAGPADIHVRAEHSRMVAAGEHAAYRAEDDDGEDGDHYACIGVCEQDVSDRKRSCASRRLLNADTKGFMLQKVVDVVASIGGGIEGEDQMWVCRLVWRCSGSLEAIEQDGNGIWRYQESEAK